MRCFSCLWQTMSKVYKDLRARENATTGKSLKSSSTSIVTLFLTTPQPRYEHVDIRGVVGRTSRSLPLKTNIVNTNAPRSCATYYEPVFSEPLSVELAGAFLWYIIVSVDSISRDEPDSPLTQYITNAGISRARYTITHFKHHHRHAF